MRFELSFPIILRQSVKKYSEATKKTFAISKASKEKAGKEKKSKTAEVLAINNFDERGEWDLSDYFFD